MNVAYNMDCMEGMKQYQDKYFDLAIVDPPYGIGYDLKAKKNGGKQYGKASAPKKMYHASNWDDKVPEKSYFEELFRVSKHQIVWGGNYFTEFLPPSKGFVCWDKRLIGITRDFADCEYAWMNPELGVARMFRFVWDGMIQGNMKSKEDRFHPTQKPVALYAWIFKNYAKPGMKILDTHLGSGSSRIAAYNAGLDFVGYEIDKEYFDKQEERFEKHISQQSLFVDYEQSSIYDDHGLFKEDEHD